MKKEFNPNNFYQRRSLASVLGQMNKRLWELQPDLQGKHVFVPGNLEDEMALLYATIDVDKEKYGESIYQVQETYRDKINSILDITNPFRKVASEAVALVLWNTPEAFRVNTKDGIELNSGNLSAIYFNGRKIPAYPDFMNLISSFLQIEYIRTTGGADVIVGGESAGIPYGTWFAKDTFMPNGYVRKKPKGYGTTDQIEGTVGPGDDVKLIEDLITDGGSKLTFIKGIRNEGGTIEDVFVVIDRQQGGKETLEKVDVNLHSLTTMEDILNVGLEYEYINDGELKSIKEYLNDPKAWHEARTERPWNPPKK
ncbi:MAG: orotate phosphoribosyltransferase [Candidatus Woesearchaeota archaeon]|nr:MAG: orotate phosphoribosyltransferase [Candidatus Woesearchaeota archaeon]